MFTKGHVHSAEVRAKISRANKGRASPLRGRKVGPFSEEHCLRISEAMMGRTAWNKGKGGYHTQPRSEETKRKISMANKGRVNSPEVRQKAIETIRLWKLVHGNPFKGKRHTPETRALIAASKKAKKTGPCPEHSARMKGAGNPNYGKRGPLCPWYGMKRPAISKANLGKKHPSQSAHMRGANNPHFGKPAYYGKTQTTLKGHPVRSMWEKWVCDWLFSHDINYNYEPRQFNFGAFSYSPDIYIPRWKIWWEVKGWWDADSLMKVKAFQDRYGEDYLMIIDKENIGMFRGELA